MTGRPSLSGSSPVSGDESPASSTSSPSATTPAAAAAAGDPFPLRPTDYRHSGLATHLGGDGLEAGHVASRALHDARHQHHGGGTHAAVAAGGDPDLTADVKKPRACESCRGLKVRCDQDPADPEGSCRRCAKAGRSCVVTQPTRKRQKKTDSRVAELEKKIDALTASLHATRRPAADDDHVVLPPLLPHVSTPLSFSSILAAKAVGADDGVRDGPPTPGVAYNSPNAPDQLARGHAAATVSGPGAAAPTLAPHSSAAPTATIPIDLEHLNQPRPTSDWMPVLTDAPIHTTPGTPTRVNAYGLVLERIPGHDDGPATSPPVEATGGHAGSTPRVPASVAGQKRKHAAANEDGLSPAASRWPADQIMGPEYKDVVTRDVVPAALAARLWERYTDQMCPHLPGVVFPPETAWSDVRRDRPLLFLAIMAAASSETPPLQRTLVKELMQILAEKLVVVGEKSIEVVQALHVAVFWYWPPEHFEELKFYQMIHMAAVLAIDIGLGSRRRAGGAPLRGRLMPWNFHQQHPFQAARGPGGGGLPAGPPPPPGAGCPRKAPPPDPCSIESRRTWLTCYFLASNTSMTLHRPNLIRWTPFMTECLEVLGSSPDAAPTDAYFCHLVWTHRLSEEVGIQFDMDDPTAVIDLADPRTRHAIRGFERDIERYQANVSPALMRPSLKLGFHVLSLYMHEIALRNEDGIDDMRSGSGGGGVSVNEDGASHAQNETGSSKAEEANLAALRNGVSGIGINNNGNENDSSSNSSSINNNNNNNNSSAAIPLTPAHIQALSACIIAIDGIFDTFLTMSPKEVRCLPVFNFVRVAYATVVLIKMHFATSRPGSELGRIIDREDIKVEQHLGSLLEKFRLAAEGDRSRPAAKFHLVLSMLRSWFQNQGRTATARSAAGPEDDGRASSTGATPSGETGRPPRRPPKSPTAARAPTRPRANSTAPYSPPSRPHEVTPTGHAARQQPHAQQAQPSFMAANTPLQVLSELAASDARGVAVSGPTTNRFSNATAPSWIANATVPQPFMYDPNSPEPVADRGRGQEEGSRVFPEPQAHGGQPLQPPQQQWMGPASIDPGNFGDGVVQAMDLTFGGGLTLLGSGSDAMYFQGASTLDHVGFGDLPATMRSMGNTESLWFGSFLESTGMDSQFYHQY